MALCQQGGLGLLSKKSLNAEACASSKRKKLAQVKELIDVFKRFDRKGDGRISACELDTVLRSFGCNAPQMDADGDGYISLYEFLEMKLKDSEADVKELIHVFKRFDRKGDGRVSASELGTALRSFGCNAPQMDADGDGYIGLYEFLEIKLKDSEAHVQMLKNAFNFCDLDNDGYISATELHTLLKTFGDGRTLQDCEAMARSVDSDCDGRINFDEFKLLS